MSEHEIEEDEPVGKTLQFFKDPIPKADVEKCPVDEAYLSAYEEMKADLKSMEETLETMNKAIKAARMKGEKAIQLGKMVAKFTEIEDTVQTDWKAMAEAEIEPDKALIAQYQKKKAGYVKVEVIRLA